MPWDTSFLALARDASSTRQRRSNRSTWTTTAATAARGETQKLQTMTQRLRRGTKGAPPWSTSEIRKIYPIWAKLLFAQASFVLAGSTGIAVHCRGYSTLYTNTFSAPLPHLNYSPSKIQLKLFSTHGLYSRCITSDTLSPTQILQPSARQDEWQGWRGSRKLPHLILTKI